MNNKNFDPNGVGQEGSGVFGLPFTTDDAQVVLIPAPWGVTVSYGGGTENAPKAMFDASAQIDYYHPSFGADSWRVGLAMLPLENWNDVFEEGVALRQHAKEHSERLKRGADCGPDDGHTMSTTINDACERLLSRIEKTAAELLGKNKLVGLVGGDHSTALGLMRALTARHEFGILQIDAHCDLRDSYEGFTHSHASIMHNALKMPQIKKLVQVGVRDYSIGENDVIQESGGRIQTFLDTDNKERVYKGDTWQKIVQNIVTALPDSVYVSFDIDGLDPALCPQTGTPVPGGLQFQEAVYLIRSVAESGKRIIGFDLVEVSPDRNSEWDANVGMRILWNLCLWSAKSNGLKPLP